MARQSQKYDAFDFRSPTVLPGELEIVIKPWAENFCSILPEKWGKYVPFDLRVELQTASFVSTSQLLSHSLDECLRFRLTLNGPAFSTLCILPRQLSLALASSMVGQTLTELPSDGPISELELSLIQLAVEGLSDALKESAPLSRPPELQMLGVDTRPDTLRFFASSCRQLALTFKVTLPFGEQEILWVLSRQVTDLLTQHAKLMDQAQQSDAAEFESVIPEVPVEISVQLGKAEVYLSDLIDLKAGDLLILNQRVSEPLVASISGDRKIIGWPGRIGVRQALQVDSIDDSPVA